MRLGMEVLSGNSQVNSATVNHSFSTLYGVAFKFNGHLNYFTNFPRDVNGAGLINPYLFFSYRPKEKIVIKVEAHQFYLQNHILNEKNEVQPDYLGFELDLKLKYNLSNDLALDFGLSSLLATPTLELIQNVENTRLPVYSFLMLTWKPTLLEQ